MPSKKKNILLYTLLVILSFPAIEKAFMIYHPGILYGIFTPVKDPDLSIGSWFDGSYQEQKMKYLTDNVGCKGDFVRLHNQLDYSLFGKVHSGILGKRQYLFTDDYVNEHFGKDFLGTDSIAAIVCKMKYLQDVFKSKGKTFLVLHPPVKDNFYAEHLPDVPGAHKTQLRNSVVYTHLCDSFGIDQIDLDAIFLCRKSQDSNLLFTRRGIHWSLYGSYIATDTIIKWLEHNRNIVLPHLKIDSVIHTTRPRSTDNDIGWTLNLIFPFAKETYTYPAARYVGDSGARLSAVYVGDSFTWTLIENGLLKNAHGNWQFWYYFNSVKNEQNMNAPVDALLMKDYNWKEQLDNTDCLVINYAPFNIRELRKFIDSAYEYYKTKPPADLNNAN